MNEYSIDLKDKLVMLDKAFNYRDIDLKVKGDLYEELVSSFMKLIKLTGLFGYSAAPLSVLRKEVLSRDPQIYSMVMKSELNSPSLTADDSHYGRTIFIEVSKEDNYITRSQNQRLIGKTADYKNPVLPTKEDFLIEKLKKENLVLELKNFTFLYYNAGYFYRGSSIFEEVENVKEILETTEYKISNMKKVLVNEQVLIGTLL